MRPTPSRIGRASRRAPLAVRVGIVTAAFALSVASFVPGALLLADSVDVALRPVSLRELSQRSVITDSAGNVIGQLGTLNREAVALREVPRIVQDAVVAVEDQTFWTNEGVDVRAVLRALQRNVATGSIRQGGSTISQQLVKDRVLGSERTMERKFREAVLAVQLNEQYSKEEILEQYLNTVYFGQGAYGVKAAVERLLLQPGPSGPVVKSLDQVTVGEAALLAGLISNPAGHDPFLHPEVARARRSYALDRMVQERYITEEQAAAAEQEPLPSIRPGTELRPRSAWVQEVQDRLVHDPLYRALGETPAIREHELLTAGLRVVSTLDPVAQRAAQAAMDQILPDRPGFTGVLVAIEPATGEVKAMVTGPGFEWVQYNIATHAPGRQAGSTWKTITLAAALESGFSPADVVDGTSPCAFDKWGQTANAEPGGGLLTLASATTGSVNCAFARTELAVGFDKIIPLAHKMGITQETLTPVLTMTLGAIETTAVEMATVAATLASGGVHRPPVFIEQVLSRTGEVLFDADSVPATRVLSADTVACETYLLRNAVTSGTGTAAAIPGRPVAGKTGSTDDLADANFLGYTPQLAAFIWHGHLGGRVPGAGYGGQVPARIFRAFMSAALDGQPVVDFPPPGPVCARPGTTISEAGRGQPIQPGLAPTPTTTRRAAPPTGNR